MARTRGAVTSKVLPVAMRLAQLGADPVGVLVEFLKDEKMKFQAAEVLMQYVYPKLKATELTLKDIPDEAFDLEVERRINLKILNGGKVG